MELLGLIDALEATILSSPKLLLTSKTIVDEPKLISIIDKMRLVIKNGGHVIQEHVVTHFPKEEPRVDQLPTKKVLAEAEIISSPISKLNDHGEELVDQARREAQDIMSSADNYALDVLEKLHLSVLKIQRNVSRIEKTLEDSKNSIKEDPLRDHHNR